MYRESFRPVAQVCADVDREKRVAAVCIIVIVGRDSSHFRGPFVIRSLPRGNRVASNSAERSHGARSAAISAEQRLSNTSPRATLGTSPVYRRIVETLEMFFSTSSHVSRLTSALLPLPIADLSRRCLVNADVEHVSVGKFLNYRAPRQNKNNAARLSVPAARKAKVAD